MNEFEAGTEVDQLLLAWEGIAVVDTSAGPREARARAEAVFALLGDHPRSRGARLVRFGLAVASVEARRGPTGVITVTGHGGHGIAEGTRDEARLRIDVEGAINYESLDRERGVDTEAACYYIPATEPAAGAIEGRLVRTKRQRTLRDGRIAIACAAGGFEEVQAITIDLRRAELRPLAGQPIYRVGGPGEWKPLSDSNTDSNICIQVNRRRLILQPVGFRASASDASPSGGTAAAQLGTAQSVWNKACIQLEVRPTILITDATLKTSSDLTAIRNAYTDPDPAVVEVFFVANSLPAQGGGQAGGIGVASCKPVIAEPNGGNPVLVSHELGHVLGLQHPGAGSNSDTGTVMAPTGSAMNPGTNLVTYFMAANIANPVLQTLMTLCCLTHDIGNHYIRDFPADVASEPSEPLPAGMNRYAMSNVWNRLTTTPGGWSASTGPEHQQPVRFNADMSPRQNYLFATVEQTVNLKVRNAVVKFFLKNPGSGGGAANLSLLGQVAVPDTLAVGVPQTVFIPWTVPAGTPAHSCIFAVVRSDAEQEGDQSSLDWWQFEALSRQDNDWAQRNLDIEDFGSGNEGDSNVVESAPFFVFLPPSRERPAGPLVLDVDARAAAGAKSVDIVVLREKPHAIDPGKRGRIRIDVGRRREPVGLVVRIRVAGGLKRGRAFAVDVTPVLGRREMVGFAAVFRVGGTRATNAQTLDVAAAAFTDVAQVFDSAAAGEIVDAIRDSARRVPHTTRRLAQMVAELDGALVEAAEELRALRQVQQVGGATSLRESIEAIARWRTEEISDLALVQAFRATCNRLEAAVSLA